MSFKVFLPTLWYFGQGALNELGKQQLPGKKALLVISNGKSMRANGYLERTENQLKSAGADYVVFDKIGANPLKSVIMEGAATARQEQCDFVVALGGGSVMDASKAIALMATNEGDLWDYVQGGTGKGKPIENHPLPIVAITTTAGTGSEVDCGGVVNNPDTNEKMGIVYPVLFPTLSIVDPELMATVPPAFTAYQGFDTLLQATECYISRGINLMCDMVARATIENVGKYLARAVKNGRDMEAREHVAFANTMSGYAMMIGSCTSEHAMEHAMSAYHPALPHGAGLIMISREYYTYFINRQVRGERFIEMAKMLGKEDASEPMDFVKTLVDLQRACGVDELKMSDYGIRPDEFEQFATNARETTAGLFTADPVEMSHEDCVEIYRKSYR
ncbi:iron-containing alcohol dehydrogenase [Bacteroides sp. An51A]|uniref:iron-containing alcohol dehydrogenase n=1 Tax=Bacteroides sp. An51A TaxID=1965640 RepID=UPI000B3A931D|nr:iron-containing alcohol dehydrogenase [Bacteroides sp. An51A]OUN79706.1 alcohol dehydrogenase [Bacteroides sp. An51A]